jgi:replicative DNA helicase
MELTEITILRNLVNNEEYCRKTLPFIEKEYFSEEKDKVLYQMVYDYMDKYNAPPGETSLLIGLEELQLSEKVYAECVDTVNVIKTPEESNFNWLVDTTEKWCKDKALYNAIMQSIKIIEGDGNSGKGELPKILSDALAVSFDSHVGHDFIDDSEERFDFYQLVEERIPFHLDAFNKITKGGLPRKTLNIALAGTGVGKSLFMCDMGASHLMMGHNVLYITMEMSEEKIAERIDANLLNIPISQMNEIPRDTFMKKIDRLREKTTGKLIIKEYPTAAANANHFRHLIQELEMKKQFTPDVIYIDYLNICSSARIKHGANVNSYSYIKSIAEELRGLAVEMNVPIISATQTTRSGYTNSDVGLEDTSESFGLPATADLMFALISTEELEGLDQILIKQLKNRYNDPNFNKRFVVGIDRSKMRLYDVEQSAQGELVNTGGQKESGFENDSMFGKKQKNLGSVEINL